MGRVAAGRASGVKIFLPDYKMRIIDKSIPNRSQPALPTTASGVVQQGTCGNYATAKHSEKKQKERRKASEEAAGSLERKTLTHKGGYLKYWNNDWKGKTAGRYYGAKGCRHIVPTRNKVERE